MAKVEMLVDDLERGDVPAVSVKSGAPCDHPVGIVLRIKSWAFFTPKVTMVVPLEPRRVLVRRIVVVSSYLALMAIAAGLVAAQLWFAYAAIAAYVVLFVLGERLWIGLRPGASDASVVVTRVHRRFAEAASR